MDNHELIERIKELEAQLDYSEQCRIATENEKNRILNSACWKMTIIRWPLDKLKTIIQHMKKKTLTTWKKIYVLAPASTSGGPETLLQLTNSIRKNGADGHIVYYQGAFGLQCPPDFIKYDCAPVTEIEDSEDNLIIVPETNTAPLSQYSRINKCIVWLSRDLYFKFAMKFATPQFGSIASESEMLEILKQNGTSVFGEDTGAYIHGYNCEYVRLLLEKNNVPAAKMHSIVGPLGDEIFRAKPTLKKDNIIAYGYSKGKGTEYIEKVIKYCKEVYPSYTYIPICNMNRRQVIDVLSKAKVYIDMGSFPGPERIPREAVWLGCNIITSTLGAANNDIDVPVPIDCKFDTTDGNIELIANKLHELCSNYWLHRRKFWKYKYKVLKQKLLFDKSVIELISR